MLGELEKRLEGVSAGVKEVLLLAKEQPDGPFQQVRGMLADLLQVSVESAALVEVALGERAQHLVVVPGGVLRQFLATNQPRWQGRVVFLPLDGPRADDRSAGLFRRAAMCSVVPADFVESRAEVRPLVDRLLGRTWIVENLATALELAESAKQATHSLRSRGRWSRADGTIAAGPRTCWDRPHFAPQRAARTGVADCRVGAKNRRRRANYRRVGARSVRARSCACVSLSTRAPTSSRRARRAAHAAQYRRAIAAGNSTSSTRRRPPKRERPWSNVSRWLPRAVRCTRDWRKSKQSSH